MRSGAAAAAGGGVRDAARRPDPARRAAAGGAGRSLRRADPAGRWAAAAGAGLSQSGFHAGTARAAGRRHGRCRGAAPLLRRRSRARAGRTLAGAGRSGGRSGRHRLCARKSPAARPGAARGVPADPGRPAPPVLRSVAGQSPAPGAAGHEQSGGGVAHSRHGASRLVRAYAAGARALLRAGRGQRPHAAQRPRLSEDAARSPADRHSAEPHRRRHARPAGAQPAERAGRARRDGRTAPRRPSASSTIRGRPCWRRRRCRPSCRRWRGISSARS